MTLGERLKMLRAEKHLTQLEVAISIGVSRPTLTAYEQNRITVSSDKLTKIATVYEVSLDYLNGVSAYRSFTHQLDATHNVARLAKSARIIEIAKSSLSDIDIGETIDTILHFLEADKVATFDGRALSDPETRAIYSTFEGLLGLLRSKTPDYLG